MKKFNYVITDVIGIHARPAGLLVKEAKKYEAKVTIEGKGKSVDATRLMAVMSLGVKKNDEITVIVEGNGEGEAAENLEKFLKENNF